MIGRADIKDQKQRRYERLRHKPLILVVTFLTPLASNSRCAAPAKLPTDNVFCRIAWPSAAFVPKRGQCPASIHGISKITLKVVVFHFRRFRPTYTTPLKSFHKVGLESSSTEHWAEITLRGASAGPSQCFVLIKQSDSLVRTSSEVDCSTPEGPEGPLPVCPSPARWRPASPGAARAVHRQPTGSDGTPCPALRANPFPEVTDPFCRLPLPTLFHRPEAVHLGDLMRYEYDRAAGTRSSGFSRPGAPTPRDGGALPAAGPYLPLSRFRSAPTAAPPLAPQVLQRPRLLLIRPGSCPDGRYRSRASAPSIFGLVDSAGELAPEVGHREPASVHPDASSAYQNGPLELDSVARLNGSRYGPTYLKFENRSRALRPDASNHWLYPIELVCGSSYPEGNFGGNQLLDGSISLSPLYPSQTNDLHRQIAGPPPEFPLASPRQA
ncbi:hypothetical protein FNV43_RR20979 [Rhamnella rubrinervis]|uniref:Uncharacterized protein n=1 Tax=Rhamnella rubrinervis TaxID=2594499 RepID=A0A8K0DZU0_9ROSA|nr:hypothetical protein FNV43_RR20979 [Rhamnella rubrinervis]